jgi:hypothetical protein
MSREQEVEAGQIWVSKDGKRVVRITRYDRTWDDCWWRSVDDSRKGRIYGSYLRERYTLTTPPVQVTS